MEWKKDESEVVLYKYVSSCSREHCTTALFQFRFMGVQIQVIFPLFINTKVLKVLLRYTSLFSFHSEIPASITANIEKKLTQKKLTQKTLLVNVIYGLACEAGGILRAVALLR